MRNRLAGLCVTTVAVTAILSAVAHARGCAAAHS